MDENTEEYKKAIIHDKLNKVLLPIRSETVFLSGRVLCNNCSYFIFLLDSNSSPLAFDLPTTTPNAQPVEMIVLCDVLLTGGVNEQVVLCVFVYCCL